MKIEKEPSDASQLSAAEADDLLADPSALAALADGLESIKGNENAALGAILARREADRLASAPVAGEAQPVAWGTTDGREPISDALKRAHSRYATAYTVPYYAAPQATEAVRDMRALLESWQAVADRIVDQYGGVVAGVDFGALGRANRAALSAQPGAQKSEN